MVRAALPRIDLRPGAWVLGALILSLAAGAMVGASATLALDIAVVSAAATLVVIWPYASLIVILLLSAEPREAFTFLVLLAVAAALAMRRPPLPGKRVIVPFGLLLLLAVPSLPLAPSPDEGILQPYLHLPILGTAYTRTPSVELHGWLNLASVLVVFCLAAAIIRTRARLDAVVAVVLASAVVPIAVAFVQLATGNTLTRPGSSLASVRGPFPHPNYFAFYLVVVLILAIMVLFESRLVLVRVGCGALIATGIVCLFLTYTRAAWVGFGLALLGMALLRYRRLILVALVGLLLGALIAPGAARDAQQRFGDLTSKSEATDQNSWTWRVDQWSAMLPYGFDRPLTGNGWDSYPRLTVRKFGHFDRRYPTIQNRRLGVYSAEGFTAHNDYVKTFVELGVPGLVLWALTLVGLGAVGWRARRLPQTRAIASATVATVAALALISFSDNLQGYTVVLLYAGAVCGALAGVTAATVRARGAPEPSRAVAPLGTAIESPAPVVLKPEPEPSEPAAPARPPVRTTVERASARLRGLFGRRR